MNKLIWTTDISLSIAKLDEQHKNLIKTFNQLFDCQANEERENCVADALTDLTNYAELYFRTEEAAMQQADYPDFEAHKMIHEQFQEEMVKFCFNAMEHQPHVLEKALNFLYGWISEHISTKDQEFKKYLQETKMSYEDGFRKYMHTHNLS